MREKRNVFAILSLFYLSASQLEASELLNANIRNEKIAENKQHQVEIENTIRKLEVEDLGNNKDKFTDEGNNVKKITDADKEISLKTISLVGSHPLKKKLEKEITKFLSAEMSEENIYLIISYINRRLIEEGYVTSFSTFKSGNIYNGFLELEIKAGKINEISLDSGKNSFTEKQEIFFAFPFYKNKVLNTKYLDQGIENLTTGRKQYRLEVIPAEKDGYSDILIYQKKQLGSFGINYDNSPIEKDRNKIDFNYSGGNIFPINDSLGLSYSSKLGKERSKNKDENFNLSYSIPFGYYKFSYNLGINKTHTVVRGNTTNIIRDGKVTKQKYKLSKVLSRGKFHRATGYIFFNQRDNETYINQEKILINSKSYSTTGLGINYSDKFMGGNLFLGVEYEKGVPWFKAEGDRNYNPKLPKKEFEKYSINIDWGKYFFLPGNGVLGYRLSLSGAYSNDRLLNINKISIGDDYTVRGFKENSIWGEKGFYSNNTITYYFSEEKYPYLQYIHPFIGLDTGVVKDKDYKSSDSIVGMGYGIRFQKDGLNGSFMISRALKKEKKHKNEGNIISFNVGYSF